MSIVPLVFRDWWEDMDRPVSRIWDQYFGRGLNRDDLISEFSNLGINRPFPTPFRSLLGNNSTYYRPWRTVTRQNSGGSSTIKMEKDNFQVILDVQQFSPDEITVKTVEKNVVVEAKHEERQDEHGFISRHFVRRYVLPTDYDAINVTSTLSSDGVLTITAPRKKPEPPGTERIINIVKTGVPAEKSLETKIETKVENETNKETKEQ
ncbi:protein lethal(2)essential for life-like [Vespa velutina]|uniref:protein lethal(2)essential for life-like n=1 Tax=Vespa velutina TaxID=202808 RepID=UPI001FB1FEBD|nr:protein lethal(2)essential for life-like [Vespa velutina]XP_047365626.1 protein lethal(2)essential for life-like [Vespa velutina]